MSGATWTLDLDSEHRFLLPFLANEPDDNAKRHVLAYFSDVVRDPVRPQLEGPNDVYSVIVPLTDVALIWMLDWEQHIVVLVNTPTHVGLD